MELSITNDLFQFAFCGMKDQWYKKLDRLALLALPEKWSYRNPLPTGQNQKPLY